MALQGNGKIVVVGGGSSFALARYNPNGSLDTVSPGDGKQTTDFGGADEATGVAIQANGKIVGRRGHNRRFRARPLQPQRLARHELLRRRQADDRLRGPPPGQATSRFRATAGSSPSAGPAAPPAAASRSPATTPTARSTRASRATASRRPTSAAAATERAGWRSRATVGSSWSAPLARGHRRRLRPRPLRPERVAGHELLGRRQATTDFDGGADEASGVALQAAARSSRSAPHGSAWTSPSPATTPTGRSTRTSPATASRRPTSGTSTGRLA